MTKKELEKRWELSNVVTEDILSKLTHKEYSSGLPIKLDDRILVGFIQETLTNDAFEDFDICYKLISFHIDEIDIIYDLTEDVKKSGDYTFPILKKIKEAVDGGADPQSLM